jgi:hypothetical protein
MQQVPTTGVIKVHGVTVKKTVILYIIAKRESMKKRNVISLKFEENGTFLIGKVGRTTKRRCVSTPRRHFVQFSVSP